MTRTYTYEICVKFNKKLNEFVLLDRNIPYSGSQSNQDRLIISKDGISIRCNRSTIIELGDIFHNYNSSIYNQILKAILYCFALDFDCHEIEQITIKLKNSKGVQINELILNGIDLNQPLDNKIITDINFNPNNLEAIFNENPKGKAVLIALSSWLRASSSKNRTYSFEKYWVGFNALYSHIQSPNTLKSDDSSNSRENSKQQTKRIIDSTKKNSILPIKIK